MISGFSFFGKDRFYKTQISQKDYEYLEGQDLIYDEIYVTKEADSKIDTEKPKSWDIFTVLNAKFQGDLEAGSLQASENRIEKIEFYKRRYGGTEWISIGQVPFDSGEIKNYSILDTIVRNGFQYEYSAKPIVLGVRGNRVSSKPILVSFEDLFITDVTGNYRLIYNKEESSIAHNVDVTEHKLLNHSHPVVIQGENNYKSGSVTALYIYNDLKQNINFSIQDEYLAREKFVNFLKNRKPKVIRFSNGETMIVRVNDDITEERLDGLEPISEVTFSFAEILDITDKNIKDIGLYQEIKPSDKYE